MPRKSKAATALEQMASLTTSSIQIEWRIDDRGIKADGESILFPDACLPEYWVNLTLLDEGESYCNALYRYLFEQEKCIYRQI